MDVSSEMAYPIIPLYLTAAFGATPALVGIIEGIAESTASLLKVFRGYVTDKYKKKKPIAFAGYATGFLYKLALLMSAFVKEKKEPRQTKKREKFWTGFSSLDGRLKLYLMIVFLFTLGNSSNTFLLLRAKSTGFDDTNVILLYFLYNLTASVLAVPFGKLSDRAGRKSVLTCGYLLFSAVYAGFAFASTAPAFIAIFAVYGVFTAMTAGVERALIAEIAPARLKGTMLGLHSTVSGIALLPASVIFGFLWDRFGTAVPFLFGAGMSMLAAVLLTVFFRQNGEADN